MTLELYYFIESTRLLLDKDYHDYEGGHSLRHGTRIAKSGLVAVACCWVLEQVWCHVNSGMVCDKKRSRRG